MIMYFTTNGDYGLADPRDLLLIDCSDFNDEDMDAIAQATDSRRIEVAWSIASSYGAVEYQPTPKEEE